MIASMWLRLEPDDGRRWSPYLTPRGLMWELMFRRWDGRDDGPTSADDLWLRQHHGQALREVLPGSPGPAPAPDTEDDDLMSATERPSSYSELADLLGVLPLLVREKRRRDGLSIRAAASASGVGASTISRFENGEDIALSTAIQLLRWVGTPTAPTSTTTETPPDGTSDARS